MSIQSVVGPLVTHEISIGVPDDDLVDHGPVSALAPWLPVVAHGSSGQERLATEFIAVLRDSFARSRYR